MEIALKNVRLSYPHLFKAREQVNEETGKVSKKFQAVFILNKKKHKGLIEEIEDAIEEVKFQKWGDKPPKLKEEKICLRDGDNEDADELVGAYKISSSNTKRPTVVDRDKSPLTEEDGKPYGGCYVNAVIRIWAQDNKFGKRINASLEAVQYYAKGDAFGAPPVDLDKHFEDFGDEEEEDRPSRSSKKPSRRDEEDDEPRSRKPARSSRRDEDDDSNEPAPSKRRSRRDEDDDSNEPAPRRRGR